MEFYIIDGMKAQVRFSRLYKVIRPCFKAYAELCSFLESCSYHVRICFAIHAAHLDGVEEAAAIFDRFSDLNRLSVSVVTR